MSTVSFVRTENCNPDTLKAAIKESLDLIGFNFNRNADKIVIKPNMCYYYHPSTGEVTDPLFVAALIDVFRENFARTSEIFVVESDASAMKCKHAFKMLEYDKMAKEKDVNLVNLTEKKCRIIDARIGRSLFTFHIPELFYEADLVVNVPKLKYMHGVKITCALKNFYGCNAYPQKFKYHKVLDEAIVFINKQIKTDLVVVDGLVAHGKYAKQLNLVMSCDNPLVADIAASKLMGISTRSVKQITVASRDGVWDSTFSPVGDFSYFKQAFPKKVLKDDLRAMAASAYLRIFREK
ncbi:MAG: DUF362 domain-containing protein [Candidatus Bathyarchaeota archaeon]|nr:DUF362 domain-containing protein [Candidatus Bathyarchaeum sp.]